jgi:putative SOS response-associated peptidase YedK
MCNRYSQQREIEALEALIAQSQLRAVYPEGRPNLEPRADICITDRAPILRAGAEGGGAVEFIQRRWSWPGPGGKPVYNFRSEGREFPGGRCLIIADGFYEFTAHSDPKSTRKHKWLFTLKGAPSFCITMLTTEPGADIAPYHSRQIVVLPPSDWARWLDVTVPARELLKPLPAGSLDVAQIC